MKVPWFRTAPPLVLRPRLSVRLRRVNCTPGLNNEDPAAGQTRQVVGPAGAAPAQGDGVGAGIEDDVGPDDQRGRQNQRPAGTEVDLPALVEGLLEGGRVVRGEGGCVRREAGHPEQQAQEPGGGTMAT